MEQSWRRSLAASPEQAQQARRRILVLEAAGMSRRQIAQRAGVAPSTITRAMAGQIELTKVIARRLAAVSVR